MRLHIGLILTSTLLTAALSGCIDASAWEDEWDEPWHHERHADAHADETEEPECDDVAPDDDRDDGDGGDTTTTTADRTDPEEAYTDADPRYHNSVDGDEDALRTIKVPFGTDRLRVALVHDSDGDIEFSLRNPFYVTVAEEDADGTKYMDESDWYVIEDPMPGEWRLDIDIDGTSEYTIGFYLDE